MPLAKVVHQWRARRSLRLAGAESIALKTEESVRESADGDDDAGTEERKEQRDWEQHLRTWWVLTYLARGARRKLIDY